MPIYSNFKFLLHKLGCGVIKEVLFNNGFLGFYTLLIVDLLRKVVLLMIYRTGLTRVVIINVHVHSQKTQNQIPAKALSVPLASSLAKGVRSTPLQPVTKSAKKRSGS